MAHRTAFRPAGSAVLPGRLQPSRGDRRHATEGLLHRPRMATGNRLEAKGVIPFRNEQTDGGGRVGTARGGPAAMARAGGPESCSGSWGSWARCPGSPRPHAGEAMMGSTVEFAIWAREWVPELVLEVGGSGGTPGTAERRTGTGGVRHRRPSRLLDSHAFGTYVRARRALVGPMRRGFVKPMSTRVRSIRLEPTSFAGEGT